eukprot:1154605-Pelagomonas_calceolata.AAC.8
MQAARATLCHPAAITLSTPTLFLARASPATPPSHRPPNPLAQAVACHSHPSSSPKRIPPKLPLPAPWVLPPACRAPLARPPPPQPPQPSTPPPPTSSTPSSSSVRLTPPSRPPVVAPLGRSVWARPTTLLPPAMWGAC